MKQSCKNVKYTQNIYSSGKSEGQDSEIRNKKSGIRKHDYPK